MAWRLSNTLEAGFCVDSLSKALERDRPEVFNTHQGGPVHQSRVDPGSKGLGVRISMDGKGRYADNIFVERLWRTVK